MVGPNPHEQRGLEAGRRERAERLTRPHGQSIGHGSRRIGGIVAVALLVAVLALVVMGWLNVDSLRPPPF